MAPYNTALFCLARGKRSHRLEAQDIALSRLVRGFESRWERHKINKLGVFFAIVPSGPYRPFKTFFFPFISAFWGPPFASPIPPRDAVWQGGGAARALLPPFYWVFFGGFFSARLARRGGRVCGWPPGGFSPPPFFIITPAPPPLFPPHPFLGGAGPPRHFTFLLLVLFWGRGVPFFFRRRLRILRHDRRQLL